MMVAQREQVELGKQIFIARVRLLQSIYFKAHEALTDWGHWSADRRGMYPTMKPPSLWNNFKRSEVQEWGDEKAEQKDVEVTMTALKQEARAESLEIPPYNERTALEIDSRIHGYGGLADEYRRVLRAAYVTREIPEDQFPKACGCCEDAFCERLESGLIFVRRWL
jgi:hypothetical protein